MPDNIKDLLHAAPFALAAGTGTVKLNFARVAETVIGAALIGGGAWFMLLPELKVEIRHVNTSIQELKIDTKELRRDIHDVKVAAAKESLPRAEFEAWRRAHETSSEHIRP